MPSQEQLAAFVEYVCRPMVEDIRIILEKAKQLELPITESLIKRVALSLGLFHLAGEFIRAACYIVIIWIICLTVIATIR